MAQPESFAENSSPHNDIGNPLLQEPTYEEVYMRPLQQQNDCDEELRPLQQNEGHIEMRPLEQQQNVAYEELRPLQQNVSDDIYDDVAPESRYPPTIMQAGNLPQIIDERPECHVRWVLAAIGLSLVVLLSLVLVLHLSNGKNTF